MPPCVHGFDYDWNNMPQAKRARKPKRAAKKTKSSKAKKLPQPRRLVRTSERSTFKRCRFQWHFDYVQRLKPEQEKAALRFGTLIHAALEDRYPKGIKRGPHPARAFEKHYKRDLAEAEASWKTFDPEDQEWIDALELGVDMLEGYVEKYGRDEEWKVIASEMNFNIPVFLPEGFEHELLGYALHPDEYGDILARRAPLFHYVGTMDGVWENRMDGRIRIVDYKTTSKDAKKEAEGKTVLDMQGTAYWTWGCDYLIDQGILKPRQLGSLDGMLYVFLYKKKRDERPTDDMGRTLNKDGTVSARQPSPRRCRHIVYRGEADREHARSQVCKEVIEMELVEKGILSAYKNENTGSNGHCTWCPYRDVCELHEAGADWRTMRDATLVTWNPYDAHEIKYSEQEH